VWYVCSSFGRAVVERRWLHWPATIAPLSEQRKSPLPVSKNLPSAPEVQPKVKVNALTFKPVTVRYTALYCAPYDGELQIIILYAISCEICDQRIAQLATKRQNCPRGGGEL
jgi:hypothetical protein